ncbi:hypothetical protein [Flavobacterium maritimum]|uniref:hypothetical protein n=1 Tax=Flavobacterium maritimum TaxID=3149042 RepID=UPI0032B31B5A
MAKYNYDLPEINERLELLYAVLQFCGKQTQYYNRKIFTTGERIAINQERAALKSFISYLFGEINIKDASTYQVSAKIEEKIDWSIHLMNKSNFKPKPRSEYLEHLKKY